MRPLIALLALMVGCTEYSVHPDPDPGETPEEVPPEALPVAVPGPGAVAKRGEEVALNGTSSYDPDDDEALLEYWWDVVEAPEGATWAFQGQDADKPKFSADTLGVYVLSLQVVDEEGLASENVALVAVEVVPWEDLEVELTWDRAVDLDVHLVAPDGTYWSDGDCFFANPWPDWGVPGDMTDDPILDLDDDDGVGPERVVLPQPEEGVYTLLVGYYNDRGATSGKAAIATLTVRAEGNEVFTATSPSLSGEGRVWIAGTLDWSTLAFTADGTLTSHTSLGGPSYNEK